MSKIDLEVSCPVFDSFRVRQVGGMFDVPLGERASQRFAVDVPDWVLAEGGEEKAEGGSGYGTPMAIEGRNTPADTLDSTVDNRSPPSAIPHSPWQIGLIVGPSGSGKSTIARAMFGDRVYRPRQWPDDRAVIDGFNKSTGIASGTQRPSSESATGSASAGRPSSESAAGSASTGQSIKEITRMLTAVGFSSPPSWIKPYRVLSGGEQFRCDLARALLGDLGIWGFRNLETPMDESQNHQFPKSLNPLVVFDEFTSVVDRNVARVVSAAISKGIRSGWIGRRFVAVTCHYDVTEWLAPDWVIDMASAQFSRRRLRRPPIELALFRCRRSAWRLFAKHHYLSGELAPFARCFIALWEGQPTAFCATLNLIGRKNRWRISRVVTLPDYQGIGIGTAVAEAVAELHRREGHRVNITASHPAMIAHCRRSPLWRIVDVKKTGSRRMRGFVDNYRGSTGRAVVSFEYVGRKDAG